MTSQGEFYKSSEYADQIVAGTKWCIFKTVDPTREHILSAVRERMHRMQTQRIDLLQVCVCLPVNPKVLKTVSFIGKTTQIGTIFRF
jgi:aryl-alcohol dehydrogenase-like predicted oxidoreductase